VGSIASKNAFLAKEPDLFDAVHDRPIAAAFQKCFQA
jgi:hypothetical protein